MLRMRHAAAVLLLAVTLCVADSRAAVTLQEFTESPTSTQLRLQGNDFGLGSNPTGSLSIVRFGQYWNVNATVTETVENGVDVLRFVGATANQHTLGPHADDLQSESIGFTFTVAGNSPATLTFNPSNVAMHPNGHADVWTVTPNITANGNDITGWDLVLEGTHTVPEPTTIAMWSVFSLTGLGLNYWRRRR
jgi:hypothetical protein